MNNKIFTEDDYMKFFHDTGPGVILKHWYVDYLVNYLEAKDFEASSFNEVNLLNPELLPI